MARGTIPCHSPQKIPPQQLQLPAQRIHSLQQCSKRRLIDHQFPPTAWIARALRGIYGEVDEGAPPVPPAAGMWPRVIQAAIYVEVLKENIPVFQRAFQDMRLTVEELIAEGGAVVARWTWTGTDLGEYDGIAPTNKVIKNTGISIYHFADGKIVDDRFESSGPSLRDQLLGS